MSNRIAALFVVAVALAANTGSNFNSEGYRSAHYRGPVTHSPEGTSRIAVPAAASVWRMREAIFIDVLPAEGAVVDPRTGRWRLLEPHGSIPGAYWFPGAGNGELSPETAHWLEQGISRLTKGRRGRMLVVFCKADCWLSWNAARRIAALGYSNVWWLSEGTDGWREAEMPLAPTEPRPISTTSDNR